MLSLDLSFLALLYVFAGLGIVFGLWLYYDLRDRNRYRLERTRVVFHCVRCGELFTRREGTEVSDCPKCGFRNPRLKF